MFTFSRGERLKSRTLLSRLFREGNSYVAYPLRVVWLPVEPADAGDFRVQVAVSVPRRAFKTAVARNRLKRRIREAYRLYKEKLYDKLSPADRRLAMMLVYIAKEELPYAEIEKGVKKMVEKMPL